MMAGNRAVKVAVLLFVAVVVVVQIAKFGGVSMERDQTAAVAAQDGHIQNQLRVKRMLRDAPGREQQSDEARDEEVQLLLMLKEMRSSLDVLLERQNKQDKDLAHLFETLGQQHAMTAAGAKGSNTNAIALHGTKVQENPLDAIAKRLDTQDNRMALLTALVQQQQKQVNDALDAAGVKMSSIHDKLIEVHRDIPQQWAEKHYHLEDPNGADGGKPNIHQKGEKGAAGQTSDKGEEAMEEDKPMALVDMQEPPEPITSMYDFVQHYERYMRGGTLSQFMTAVGVSEDDIEAIQPWYRDPTTLFSAAMKPAADPRGGFSFRTTAGFVEIRLAMFTSYWCLHQMGAGRVVVAFCTKGLGMQSWHYDADMTIQADTGHDTCLDASGIEVGRPPIMAPCVTASQSASASALKGQQWEYLLTNKHSGIGALRNKATGLCLGIKPHMPGATAMSAPPELAMQGCHQAKCNMLWSLSRNATTPATFYPTYKQALQLEEAKRAQIQQSKDMHLPLAKIYQKESQQQQRQGVDADNGKDEKQPSVLCWVMTSPSTHFTRDIAINATWGRECNLLLFMTTKHQGGLNTIVLPLGEKEDRHFLWRKDIMSWGYVYEHFLQDYEWFIRADDDSFLNMDNLRNMVKGFDADEEHWFGRRLASGSDDFYSGGPGTVLSRGVLKAFGDNMRSRMTFTISSQDTFADDAEFAVSLKKLGILPSDSRDADGLERFTTLSLADERSTYRSEKTEDFWYFLFSFYRPKEGADAVSRAWVGSHYNTPNEMFMMKALHDMQCEGAGQHPWEVK